MSRIEKKKSRYRLPFDKQRLQFHLAHYREPEVFKFFSVFTRFAEKQKEYFKNNSIAGDIAEETEYLWNLQGEAEKVLSKYHNFEELDQFPDRKPQICTSCPENSEKCYTCTFIDIQSLRKELMEARMTRAQKALFGTFYDRSSKSEKRRGIDVCAAWELYSTPRRK